MPRDRRLKTALRLTIFVVLLALTCSLPSLLWPRVTEAPTIQCTPPPCAADETYACGRAEGCPGGCGTICVKLTPDAGAAPTTALTEAGCAIVVRTPPAEAPTATVNGTAEPNRRIDPHVATCAATTQLRVGDTWLLAGRAVQIGLPLFQVSVRDQGAGPLTPLVSWRFDGQTDHVPDASALLAFDSGEVDRDNIILRFTALAPGTVELVLSATGEVHYGSPGPATWAGGASDLILITITAP